MFRKEFSVSVKLGKINMLTTRVSVDFVTMDYIIMLKMFKVVSQCFVMPFFYYLCTYRSLLVRHNCHYCELEKQSCIRLISFNKK